MIMCYDLSIILYKIPGSEIQKRDQSSIVVMGDGSRSFWGASIVYLY
jgi:hypothetical protein